MKSLIHNKQVIQEERQIRVRYQKRSYFLMVILFFILVGIVLWCMRTPVISPCQKDGCVVKVVMAQEPKTELQEVIDYIIKVFEPEGRFVVFQALAIAECESHWNTKAYGWNAWNQTGDYSLFQVNSVHTEKYGEGFMYDWKKNVDVAHDIFKQSGWGPWVCKKVL